MKDDKEIIVKSENDRLVELENKIDFLIKAIYETERDSQNNFPIKIDMRYAKTIMLLNDEYYGLFANMKNSLDYVPYSIIEKGIIAAEKSYKHDLKQARKSYMQMLKAEKKSNRNDK